MMFLTQVRSHLSEVRRHPHTCLGCEKPILNFDPDKHILVGATAYGAAVCDTCLKHTKFGYMPDAYYERLSGIAHEHHFVMHSHNWIGTYYAYYEAPTSTWNRVYLVVYTKPGGGWTLSFGDTEETGIWPRELKSALQKHKL